VRAKLVGVRAKLAADILTWAGSGLVVVSSVIHFHLWASEGYDNIPTIGPLFLMQAVVGWLLALGVSVFRRWPLVGLEAGFALATAAGLIISVNVSLFGWKDTLSAPFAVLALAVEFAATAVLLAASAILFWAWSRRHPRGERLRCLLQD
jgi:hypothetical protein